MVKYIKQDTSDLSNSTGLPSSITLAPDGSPVLVGEATVWNDQISNSIVGHNTVSFSLVSQQFEQEIPYGVYGGKCWVKVNVEAGKSITVKFVPDATKTPDNDKVFILYDDFDTQESSKWAYQNSTISGSVLSVTGGNIVYGPETTKTIPNNVVIEWNMYSGNYDFDSGFKVGNLYFISDKGSGSHTVSTAFVYPSGSQQANKWNDYRVILRSGDILFTNKTVDKTVKSTFSYIPGPLQWVCDSDTSSNPLRVDYICIRKYLDETKIDVKVTAGEDGSYTATITNLGDDDIVDTEIPINVSPGNYCVTVTTITPVLVCDAFSYDKNSHFTFYTQFMHSAKIDGKCEFHLHTYIPPDAPNGDVKLHFEWMTLPVNGVYKDGEYVTEATSNAMVKKITKTFTITDEMKGKHIVLSFGELDVVRSLSQIIFCKLERLATDTEDTFEYVLPVLYIDWHTEIDTLGSQDIYKK